MPVTSPNYITCEGVSVESVVRKRFAVSGKGEDYLGVNLSPISITKKLKLESHPSFQDRASGTTIDARWYRVYPFDDKLKTTTTSYNRWRIFNWWPGASHLRGKVPRIYLPGTSSNAQSASAQPRKEDSITSGESPPAKGASDGSKVDPESEPLKSESKRESSLTNKENVKANWM